VAELVEATTFIRLFLWSFRCFDRLSNHKLNDRRARLQPLRQDKTLPGFFGGWVCVVVEPVEAITIGIFPTAGVLTGSTSAFHSQDSWWLSLSKPLSSLAFSCGRFDVSIGSATTGSTTHRNQFLDTANPVAELVEATIFVSLFLWSFRCFDRLSNHKLNDHFSKY